MAKFNLQQFLLAKGEKIGLGLAAGGLGLLGIWGVSNLISAKSPAQVSDSFKKYKSQIENKIAQQDASSVTPIPVWADPKALDSKPIAGNDFPVEFYAFEPVDRPSRARDNPKVLGIKEAQLDLVRLNMKAYDISGQPGDYLIGVMNGVSIQGDNFSAKDMKAMLGKLDPKRRVNKARLPQNPQFGPNGMPIGPGGPGGAMGGPGGGMGGPGGAMGGPGGGMGGPGGINLGGAGGGGMGMGGPGGGIGMGDTGGPGGYNSGAQYDSTRTRYEKTVTRIPIDQFDPAKHQPAFVIYPRRTIVMHAVFPLKEQLEVVRRALRLKTIDEAARETSGNFNPAAMNSGSAPGGGIPGQATMPPPGAPATSETGPGGGMTATTGGGVKVPEGPTFAGFEVERKIIAPNGTEYPWTPYDHVGWYLSQINNRKVADQPDEGFLPYFLRYDQEMAMPLPAVAEGQHTYPPITLPSIVQTVQKMKDQGKQVITPSELQQRFNGKGNNPFTPSFLPPTGAAGGPAGSEGGFFGGQNSGSMSIGLGGRGMPPMGSGGMMPPGAMMPPGGMRPGPGGYPNSPGGMMMPEIKAPVELEHMLIRFMDVDIRPGHTYEYKIRVKMKNPNYGVKNVSRPSDSEVPVLFGPWVTLANPDTTPMRVTVPYDVNTYLVDPVEYAKNLRDKQREPKVQDLLDNQNGKLPVIEVQQWLEQVSIEDKAEPIGAWVVGDVPVARGEFIGKKQLTTMPLWSSQKVRYILQELPKYKVPGVSKDHQPKGVLVDFTTSNICVDYDGGKQTRPFEGRSLEDEGAVEMLILNADGSLTVRNSGVDTAVPERIERVKNWDEWIERVKADTAAAGELGVQPMGGGFGPAGGGSGPGVKP
ncbi:hypothetical protein [Limnoglobus roseus]|uniref:Uncharacterized protein n=1 Tax=Limnoglobus roseus TaxID=2598579 RepID=A0A5C1AFC3_9BACT|nr:hypothetical protein [Limnoglobus roseus]QEL16897.1 hypothetical protein PX52LOC_03872 [Limnoglobus roseus]